jgi:RNA polymerase sigma-70 factor, ECF subfamily
VGSAGPLRAHADFDVARRCASGDRIAQRDFFRRERGRVHTILWRIVGSNVDMEDLVQDAFMEIFRSMPRFRGESSLATWLDRITVRVAYAHLGRRRADTVHLSVVPEPVSGDASAEDRAISRETLRRLYAALDQIESKQRIAFVLHVIDGRPLKDVATAMEASLVATKVRVWRARRTLLSLAERDPLMSELLESARVTNEESR